MHPEISEVFQITDRGHNQGETFYPFQCTNFRVGTLFKMDSLDLESPSLETKFQTFQRLLSQMSDDVMIRLNLHSSDSQGSCGEASGNSSERKVSSAKEKETPFRWEAMERLGYVKREITFSIEKEGKAPFGFRGLGSLLGSLLTRPKRSVRQDIDSLISKLPRPELSALGARPLSREETLSHFKPLQAQVFRERRFLDLGKEVVGVIRLFRQGREPLGLETLSGLTQRLPLPFEISVSVKKLSKMKADLWLRAFSKKESLVRSEGTDQKMSEVAELLKSQITDGETLFDMEWLLILRRKSEGELKTALSSAMSLLSAFGDGVLVETWGCLPSYQASLFGAGQHVPFKERGSCVPYFFPVLTHGESSPSPLEGECPSRALLLHREDGSPHVFDLFNPKFLAFNLIVSGKTGSGKSAFGNTLSSSLLRDPSIQMVKIDVGGSYRKECELEGGKEVSFSLDHPSGINPFGILKELPFSPFPNDAVATLSEFLATLIKEEGESFIPKMTQADIERALKEYVQAAGLRSLSGFHGFAKDFPRRALLARWVKGGVFENALLENSNRDPSSLHEKASRYTYFNFQNIQGASNKDFATGVMAAVIAQVNLEMLRLSSQSKGEQSVKRLVLFCDETKFFIERNASFFLLTTANFRKFGHSVILLCQNIRDFELKTGPSGSGDNGIILNSPIRVLFPTAVDEEYLQSTFQLSDRHCDALLKYPYRGKEYREAILQDDTGTRLIRISLTPEEYWQVTTTKEDTERYDALRRAVPGLTPMEAIQALTQLQRKVA